MVTREYLNASLRPLLRDLGVTSGARDLICDDVRQRLESVLGNWSDEKFRRTVLMLGLEEATFYEPAVVPLEVRAAVVVAVRNSMVEDLSATHPWVPALRRFAECMPDSFVPRITREALLFFNGASRTEGGWGVLPPRKNDLFRELARIFPESWRRLEALAHTKKQEVRMDSAEVACEEEDRALKLAKHSDTQACVSGYMADMTAEEAEIFTHVSSAPGQVFFCHSFKWFTRNPLKLLRGIETVIKSDGAFVTSNYYISRDYCACRRPLMRPAHTVPQLQGLVSDVGGLVGRHKASIEALYVKPSEGALP